MFEDLDEHLEETFGQQVFNPGDWKGFSVFDPERWKTRNQAKLKEYKARYARRTKQAKRANKEDGRSADTVKRWTFEKNGTVFYIYARTRLTAEGRAGTKVKRAGRYNKKTNRIEGDKHAGK